MVSHNRQKILLTPFAVILLVTIGVVFVNQTLPVRQTTVPTLASFPTPVNMTDNTPNDTVSEPDEPTTNANGATADTALNTNLPTSASIEPSDNVDSRLTQTVTKRVLIQFVPDTSVADQTAYLEQLDAELIETIPALNIVVIERADTTSSLPASPAVVMSEPDYYAKALLTTPTNDPLFGDQWGLTSLNIGAVWQMLPAAMPSITVAVIDSGICATHPDFAGRILAGYDFVENDATPQDEYGHGCAVAGVIAANADNGIGLAGIAPNARVLPLRVLDANGVGLYSNVAAAIVRAADSGAAVINLSLGGPNRSAALESAINYALGKGVTIVAAAGNTGQPGVYYPAAYAGVIGVGAADPDGSRSAFSSYGAELDTLAPGRNIVAPGINGDYVLLSGTSLAAPHVSGLAAMAQGMGEKLILDGGMIQISRQVVSAITDSQFSDENPVSQPVQALAAGDIQRVSVGAGNIQSNNSSGNGRLSADGRFVIFHSFASNLVAGDSNGKSDVFLHDALTGTTTLISRSSAGVLGNDQSGASDVSDDGRYITFSSSASNLVAGDIGATTDQFLRDQVTGQTSRIAKAVGINASGPTATNWGQATMSADGRYIAFVAITSEFVTGDDNPLADIFLYDRVSGTTKLVSNDIVDAGFYYNASSPHLTRDGEYIIYSAMISTNINLVPANSISNLFVYDVAADTTTRITPSSSGAALNDVIRSIGASQDGRYIAFLTDATNVVPNQAATTNNIFIYDVLTGYVEHLPYTSALTPALSFSEDGRLFLFTSRHDLLVNIDSNFKDDVYLYDRQTHQLHLISYSPALGASSGYAGGSQGQITPDGRFAVFSSASNLVPEDTGTTTDVFISELPVLPATDRLQAPSNLTSTWEYTFIPAMPVYDFAARLTWTTNTWDLKRLLVERSVGGGSWSQIAVIANNGNTSLDEDMVCDTDYQYRVRGEDVVSGEHTPYSETILVRINCSDVPLTDLHVNVTADEFDGACTLAHCSLRDAIAVSNAMPMTQTALIPAGVYTLTIATVGADDIASGDLNITDSINIAGAGAKLTQIDGTNRTIFNSRGSEVAVSIRNMEITNGGSFGIAIGRGQFTGENLYIHHHQGRGLLIEDTYMAIPSILRNSTVSHNDGGGIRVNSGRLDLFNVTVSNNVINSAYTLGGGIHNISGIVNIYNSTIVNNRADEGGGSYGPMTVHNSIIVNNTAGTFHANCRSLYPHGSYNIIGRNTVGAANSSCFSSSNISSTNTLNAVLTLEPLQDNGGSVPTHRLPYRSLTIGLGNPIEPGSIETACLPTDAIGTPRLSGHCDPGAYQTTYPANVVRTATTVLGRSSDITDTAAVELPVSMFEVYFSENLYNPAGDADPQDVTNPANYQLFGAGANNTIETANCGAVQDDDISIPVGVAYDWLSRKATLSITGVVPLAVGSYRLLICDTLHDLSDMALDGDYDALPGTPYRLSFSVTPLQTGTTLIVSTTQDTSDGACGPMHCSLRDAILTANSQPDETTIVLAASSYRLAIAGGSEDNAVTGDLDVTSPIIINGAGITSTEINGYDLDRVFHIRSGGDLALYDLTVTNGTASNGGSGGNLFAENAPLTLNRIRVLSGIGYSGGGIVAVDTTIAIFDSIINHNNATPSDSRGAGLGLYNSITLIERSTIVGNVTSSGGQGGGIYSNGGELTLRNVLVGSNQAYEAAGLSLINTRFTANNISVTNNYATSSAADGIRHTGLNSTIGNSIIAQSNRNCDLGVVSDQKLTSLGNNLITDTTCGFAAAGDIVAPNAQFEHHDAANGMVFADFMLPNEAVSAGNPATCEPVDQLGSVRDDGPCDIGAYEEKALPAVIRVDTAPRTGAIAEGSTVNAVTNALLIDLNKPVQNPVGDSDLGDVTNPASYRLLRPGANGTFETTTCEGDPGDDGSIVIDSVAYMLPGYVTLNLNGGINLPEDDYRLIVCDDLHSLAGVALDGDADGSAGGDFVRTFRLLSLQSSPAFYVNTTLDADDGYCSVGHCSLREALRVAQINNGAVYLPQGVYQMALAGQQEDQMATGDYDINGFVSIVGAGAATTIIDANGLDRVFDVSGGFALYDVTVRGGQPEATGNGGGIRVRGDGFGTVNRSVIENNQTPEGTGGGVFLEDWSQVQFYASRILNNTAKDGGGIAFAGNPSVGGDRFRLYDTLVQGNTATGDGGGVYFKTVSQASAETMVIYRTTIAGNSAQNGGGMYLTAALNTPINVTLAISTLSGNQALNYGGAIYASSNTSLTVSQTTITANQANTSGANTGSGGGIYLTGTASPVSSLSGTIVYGNSDNQAGAVAPDCNGQYVTHGNNLIGSFTGCTLTPNLERVLLGVTLDADLIGQNPLLQPLTDNGGPTPTHALAAGSPASGAGSTYRDLNCSFDDDFARDQRGMPMPAGQPCGIGAYYGSSATPPAPLVVRFQMEGYGDSDIANGEIIPGHGYNFDIFFNQPMFAVHDTTLPNTLTNASNYRFVAAGTNGTLETSTCGTAQGDDILQPVTNVVYNAEALSVRLMTAPVVDGQFRLIICGAVEDYQHRLLDGNGDGVGGDPFIRDFSMYMRIVIEDIYVSSVIGGTTYHRTLSDNPIYSLISPIYAFSIPGKSQTSFYNAPGTTDPNDVDNPDNYRLYEDGGDNVFQTTGCTAPQGDDTQLPVGDYLYAAYTGLMLTVNNGQPLPTGHYRFIICPTLQDHTHRRNLDGNGDGVLGDAYIRDFWVNFFETLNAPTNLRSAGVASDVAVWLNWDDNANAETAYFAELSTDQVTWSAPFTFAANATSGMVNGLTCNNTYYFRVRAYNSQTTNYSPYSNVLTWTQPACTGQPGPVYTITHTDDQNDGLCSDVHCSLREAVIASNGNANANTITLAADQIYSLNTSISEGSFGVSALVVTQPLTIEGNGARIRGNGSMRLFRNGSALTLHHLTLQNGWLTGTAATSRGGAILNEPSTATLTAQRIIFDSNLARLGGAVYSTGSFNIQQALFTSNSPSMTSKGVIYLNGSAAVGTIINSTFADNGVANPYGTLDGIIFIENGASATLRFNTFNDNQTTIALRQVATGQYTLLGNLFNQWACDATLSLVSEGYNLVSNASCNGFLTHATDELNEHPRLMALADYGGTVPTYALRTESAARDKIPPAACVVAEDARGAARPQNFNCDIGAYEVILPATPTNLTAAALDENSVVLNWQDNATDEANYGVQRKDAFTEWTWYALLDLPANSVSFTQDNVTCNHTYQYRVVAQRTGDYILSAYSDPAEVTTPLCDSPATPSGLQLTVLPDNPVQLDWQDNATNETQYHVERSRDGISWSILTDILGADSTTYVDVTSECGRMYHYRVRAHNTTSGLSSAYVAASITTNLCAVPYAPSAFSVTGTTRASIALGWVDEDISETVFYVERSPDGVNDWASIATLPSDAATHTDSGLFCAQTYYYRVRGERVTDHVFSAWTAVLEALTAACPPLDPPPAPAPLNITRTSTTLTLTVPVPEDVNILLVERGQSGAGAQTLGALNVVWQQIAILPVDTLQLDDPALSCGTMYYYRTRTYRAEDDSYSSYSAETTVITLPCPVPVTNTVGLYQTGIWLFRDANDSGLPTVRFAFGPQEAGWTALAGDWNGDGEDGIGLYKQGTFVLRNVSSAGLQDVVFQFGDAQPGWLPIVGDWNGDDVVTIGVYKDGVFLVRDSNSAGIADYRLQFDVSGLPGALPLVGDWDGNGADEIGLYHAGKWYLPTSLTTPFLGRPFVFGPTDGTWQPVAGDWNSDGITTIGVYKAGVWRLRNSNSEGMVDLGFTFNEMIAGWQALASYRGGAEALALLAFSPQTISAAPTDAVPTANPTEILPEATPIPTESAATQPTLPPEITPEVVGTTDIPPTEATPPAALPTEITPVDTPPAPEATAEATEVQSE